MTLKQAFTMWSCDQKNTVLAARSRAAVQQVLMKKWNDIDLEQFSEKFCRRIFYRSTEKLGMKVQAASVLIQILQWGHEKGCCNYPAFTYDIAMEEHRRAERDKNGGTPVEDKPERIKVPTLAEIKGVTIDPLKGVEFPGAPEPLVRVKPEALARRKAELKERKKNKEPKTMEKRKPGGKKPRKVCQIDPETLKVVKTYDSCSEGCREAGVKGLDRAIKKLQRAGGYYWQYPEDVETFAERLKGKQETPKAPKPEQKKPDVSITANLPEAGDKNLVDKFNEDAHVFERMKREGKIPGAQKFKVGDHVWAMAPEEVFGRTGYVAGYDSVRGMYKVRYGEEEWLILESCLVHVDEKKYQVKRTYKPADEEPAPARKEKNEKNNAAHDALAVFSDDELLAELDRRGWQGELSRTQIVSIGK